MKKMIFALVMMLTATLSASAMSYERARQEALFLTDKMAYELNLTDAQYEAAYEINLDYLMGVATYDDVYGPYWERRNMDMSYILYQWQWDAFCAASYFYRPLYWSAGHWHFGIYARYTVRDYFYFGQPHFYATYRGGHAWHVNGGRSWYHGRADHFRPALPNNRQHFGMRSQWDRGDFRGRSHTNRNMNEGRGTFRGSSSTRVTAGRNERSGSFGRSAGSSVQRSENRGSFGTGRNLGNGSNSGQTRNFGTGQRPTTTTTAPQSSNNTMSTPNTPTRTFGNTNRSNSSVGSTNSSTPTRSFGNTSSSRPSVSSSTPTRSFGNASSSRPSVSSSTRSSSTRSSSSAGSSRSSNSNGHFGGRR